MELNSKINSYQSILASKKRMMGSQSTGQDDLDLLLMQGSSLAENGNRLMRIKSKPGIIAII